MIMLISIGYLSKSHLHSENNQPYILILQAHF